MNSVQEFLNFELNLRKSSNTGYSLRAFARDLGISRSRLSEILSGKGGVSLDYAKGILQNLKLSEREEELFLILAKRDHGKSKKLRHLGEEEYKEFCETNRYSQLQSEEFRVISDWYHFAIMAIMELDDFDGSIGFIHSKIDLDPATVENAIERLSSLGFVSFEKNKYFLQAMNLKTSSGIRSRAIQSSHKQKLKHVENCLDTVPVELRDVTSITMSVSKDRLPEAKERIKNFRRELASFLEGGEKDSVYDLNIQLVPVTKIGEES